MGFKFCFGFVRSLNVFDLVEVVIIMRGDMSLSLSFVVKVVFRILLWFGSSTNCYYQWRLYLEVVSSVN